MRKCLLAICSLIVFHFGFGQSKSALSAADLQYVKDFFAANFIKSEVKYKDGTQGLLYNYEITDEAIILYKQNLSRESRESGRAHSWYYLAFDNILFRNWNNDIGYYKNVNALRIQEKKSSIPHGIGRKFTKPSDAKYEVGWVMPPFKYKSYADLERLKNIFEPASQPAPVKKDNPALVKKEELLSFKSPLLTSLYGIARQLNETNMEAVMRSEGYTLQEDNYDDKPFKYSHKKERSVYLVKGSTDSSYTHILKAFIIGLEVEEMLNDFEANKIDYVHSEEEKPSTFYYFAKEDSPYVFRIQEGELINYIYIFKIIKK